MILRISIGVFYLSAETAQAVEAIKEDRLFLRSRFDIHGGGVDKAVAYLEENQTPALLIVETTATGDAFYGQLNNLADVCAPDTVVLLIGAENDVALYRELIRLGIGDYLVGPVNADQLKGAISALFGDEEAGDAGRVIAFTGASGGVGSSVIAHNVAFELAKAYEKDVILIDLDIAYGTAGLAFNLQPRQTIVDILSQVDRLDEAIIDQYLLEVADRLSVLCSPASVSAGVQVSIEQFDGVMKIIRRMADLIILDVPHVWDPCMREILIDADDLVIVSRPDLTNLRNAKNMVEFFGQHRGDDVINRLVLSQAGAAKRADISEKDFRDALAMEPSVIIPYDPEAFCKAMNSGEMMSRSNAKNKATEAIIKLAKIVSGLELEEKDDKKKSFSFFSKDRKKK